MTTFRRHGRRDARYTARLHLDDLGEVTVETQNVSESGVLIRCKHLKYIFTVGEELEVSLFCDSPEGRRALFRVTRVTEDGLALSFS